jgi:hypothetical protein
MPVSTLRRRKSKPASAERVKQLLVELTYRLHTTRVVATKPTATK